MRWRWATFAAWLVGGGLWVLVTLVAWLVNPVDDQPDRSQSAALLQRSFAAWSVVGLLLAAWIWSGRQRGR